MEIIGNDDDKTIPIIVIKLLLHVSRALSGKTLTTH